MNKLDNIALVRYHAGLEDHVTTNEPSLAEVLWRKTSFESSFEDLMKILQRVNIEMNGATPSAGGAHESHFPRTLIYAVHELVRLLRQTAAEARNDDKKGLEYAAWRLEVGWSAILAGDIDNLDEHIAEEEAAGSP